MTTPMLEKCARAINPEAWRDPTPTRALIEAAHLGRQQSAAQARAVLTALLEPDEGMVRAIASAMNSPAPRQEGPTNSLDRMDLLAKHMFTAAIREALKGDGA